MRIGIGYDVHRFAVNRKLILGGVEIQYEKGLLGHSDADVLVHAIMDAILGALAKRDIGTHFPDTDDAYKGADSLVLLAKVNDLMEEENFKISNIDCVIVAQAPKLAKYINEMENNIATVLNISKNQINVKATTEEHLGFTGEKLGMKATAVVLLEKSK